MIEEINPEILVWARETAGFSLDEAAKKLNIKPTMQMSAEKRLEALESGRIKPSRAMLKNMSQIYRRPLIAFYLEKPPKKANRGQDFRTLSGKYTEVNTGLIDALIRNIKARQSILRSVLEDDEEIKPLTFVGSMKIEDGVDEIAKTITETTSFSLKRFQEQRNQKDAFNYVRNLIENIGVYIILMGDLGNYLSSFDLELFRGFSISDELAPFIVINNKDSKAAWSFTLFHELTHIWLGQTGISGYNAEQKTEMFCNKVASKILLPDDDPFFKQFDEGINFEEQIESISNFAQLKNVSSSMVAYKLFTLDIISQSAWYELRNEFRKFWFETKVKEKEKIREKDGGPNFYNLRRSYLGENLLSQVYYLLRSGSLSSVKASKVLGLNPKQIQNLYQTKNFS